MSITTEPRAKGAAGGARSASSIVRHFGLATLCLVLFLTFLDNTVVSVTLANVQSSLHTGVVQLQWVVDGYALVFASFMLPAGALADRLGRKKVMLVGVGLFCAGSTLAALAPNASVLIAARAVMGLGAAASEPGTLSMIRHLYTDEGHRARALGIWAAVSGVALAVGPLVGGTLVGLWSWRAIFWFNLFIGAVALAMTAIFVPESADREAGRIDIGGIILGALTLATASFAIIQGEQSGYVTWWIDAFFAASIVFGLLFLYVEHRVRRPILDFSLFRRGPFAGSLFVAFAAYFGTFSIFFFTALYLQVVVDASPYATAVTFIPMAAGLIIASLLTGPWVARQGPRIPMTVGCVLAAAGILITGGTLGPHVDLTTLGWILSLAGIGFGIMLVPVTSTPLTVVPPEHSGMAASATNTSREMGAVFGVAVLGSIVNAKLTGQLAARLKAIGIPPSFQNLVIHAVTGGGLGGGGAASSAEHSKNATIAKIATKVVNAAYQAFGSGLHVALNISGILLLVGAVVSLLTIHGRRADSGATSTSTLG